MRGHLAALGLCLTGALAAVPAEAQRPYPGVMEPVGALHCRVSAAEGEARLRKANLLCQFRHHGRSQEPVHLEGEIIGSGLHLVEPGVVQVMWNVLAPTREVRPEDIAGDYDISPTYKFALKEERSNILYGGLGDTFALELVSHSLDAITPSTRMRLDIRAPTLPPANPG